MLNTFCSFKCFRFGTRDIKQLHIWKCIRCHKLKLSPSNAEIVADHWILLVLTTKYNNNTPHLEQAFMFSISSAYTDVIISQFANLNTEKYARNIFKMTGKWQSSRSISDKDLMRLMFSCFDDCFHNASSDGKWVKVTLMGGKATIKHW